MMKTISKYTQTSKSIDMARLEFYIYEGELWVKDDKGRNELVDQTKSELIDYILAKVRKCYPDAYKALQEKYKDSSPNKIYYRYKMAMRFLKCNFGQLDSTTFDIDGDTFNFERVDCPLRLECKYDGIICSPLYKTSLSAQEMRIGRLWYEGLTKEEIAGMMFLSVDTVNNHIRNIYQKLNIHDKAEFTKYSDKNNIFK